MTQVRAVSLTFEQIERGMRRAIEVAQQSTPEDDRHHPKVGAVLLDANGAEVLTAYRGSGSQGGHAEYSLLLEASRTNIDLSDKFLFVTLEPCSRRSLGKMPCAVRVAQSGIKTVYVGTLDPNPQILGRGVNFLIESGLTVEHFPASLRAEIIEMNAAFHFTHAFLADPVVPDIYDKRVSERQRAGILATTLDLIATAEEQVRIFTGDTSWLEDLFVGLLEASARGVPIKMIACKQLTEQAKAHALAIGITVAEVKQDSGIRATIVDGANGPKSMILVEREPIRHAHIFAAPYDHSVLAALSSEFDKNWTDSAPQGSMPKLEPIPIREIVEALRATVGAYRDAEIFVETVPISTLFWLTNDVEIFKLRRVAATIRTMERQALTPPVHISGTPWGFFPPVVERDRNGNDVLIDGVHRVYSAVERGHTTMPVLIVKGVEVPLPAAPVAALEPRIVGFKRPRTERYRDYNGAVFRPIRRALQQGAWTKR